MRAIIVNNPQVKVMRTALTEMSHKKPPTPAMTDRETGDIFVNANNRQILSRSTNMSFYWVIDRVRQGKLLVYWVAREHNIADYFTKHHPTNHDHSKEANIFTPQRNAVIMNDI